MAVMERSLVALRLDGIPRELESQAQRRAVCSV